MRIYSFQHADDVLGVVKRPDFIATSAVDDGHCLQTNTLHCYLGCQQEPMVQVIEKLVPTVSKSTINLLFN